MIIASARGACKREAAAAMPMIACLLPRARLAGSMMCCLPLQLGSVLISLLARV